MSVSWLYEPSESQGLLKTILQYEQQWQEQFSIPEIEEELSRVVSELQGIIDPEMSAQQNLYVLLDTIVDEIGFTGPGLQMLPESALANLSFCVMHRTGNQITLSIVFAYLLQQLGYKAIISDIPEGIALVVQLTQSEYIVIDALSGGSEYLISQQDVKENLTDDIARYANRIETEELLKIVLTDQKVAMLDEGLFAEALNCVEILMELLPEDPYERRDRGLVLSQLDCEQWAKDDLDYFVKACPNDPMAMFIRLQLEEQKHIVATIH